MTRERERAMTRERERERVLAILDPLIAKARTVRAAEIDAGCCGTAGDWDRLYRLEKEYAAQYDAAVLALSHGGAP
jgi:hypothetical protein